ncbi:MAG: PIN domain-containing protein [Terriglobia bacterium]|jgi:predicted nucleic acid-binding protein
MSGKRYLLDTNAIVCLLRDGIALQQRLESAEWVGISILSQIEFLAFPNLTENDRRTFQEFSDAVEVVGLGRTERALIDRIVSLRAQHRLKLPDAIIAATAVERDATLITDDHQLQKLSAIRSSGTSAPE